MRVFLRVLHVLHLLLLCEARSPQSFLKSVTQAPAYHIKPAVHRLLSSNSSNETSEEIAEVNTEPPSVNVEELERIATGFLPNSIAGLVVALLLVMKTVHDNVQSAFENMPEAALVLFITLLGLFSWMVCDMYLDITTHKMLLDEIGEWLTLMGLFAESMLLITPLILCVPAQGATKEVATSVYGLSSTNCAQKFFGKTYVKLAMMWIYIMFVIFQISSAYPLFRIAEMKEDAMKQNTAIGFTDFQESTGPYMICLLYLVLAYCNIATVYEYIFDASFQEDFPKKIFQRLRGVEPAADSTTDQSTTEQSAESESSTLQSLTEHIAAIKELKALPKAFKGLEVSFQDQTQKLLASISQLFPAENTWKLKLHWVLYQVSLFGILAFVGVLNFRMLLTVGTSAAAVVFGALVVSLMCFCLVFGFFGTMGVMGGRAGMKMESAAPARPPAAAAPPPCAVAPAPLPVGMGDPVFVPAVALDFETERELLAKFGNFLDAVVLCTTGPTHYAALVFKSDSLPQIQTREEGIIHEIGNWIEGAIMERDNNTFTTELQIFIMDGPCLANIAESALANLRRAEVVQKIFFQCKTPAQVLPVVTLANVQSLAAPHDNLTL